VNDFFATRLISTGTEAVGDLNKAEDFLKRRISLRMTVNAKRTLEEALSLGHRDDIVRRALAGMILRGELQELNSKKLLRRIR
jgi:hypothetical protein